MLHGLAWVRCSCGAQTVSQCSLALGPDSSNPRNSNPPTQWRDMLSPGQSGWTEQTRRMSPTYVHILCNSRNSYDHTRKHRLAKVVQIPAVDNNHFHLNCLHLELCMEAFYRVGGRRMALEDVHLLIPRSWDCHDARQKGIKIAHQLTLK